jgi:phosphoribosylglycinamide formyltransferase-1
MTRNTPLFVFMMSTGGAVMNQLLQNRFLKSHIHSVVVDRNCGALQKARNHAIQAVNFNERDPQKFCDSVEEYMDANGIQHVIAFYTEFFSKSFRDRFKNNIVNPHPSLLPAFKGLSAFEDGIKYGSKIIGTTIEFPRDEWDQGAIVAQTACPADFNDVTRTRHRIFVQQCKSIVQVVKWIVDGRVKVVGERRVTIEGAKFGSLEYAPELDFPEVIDWEITMPERLNIGF